MPSYTDTDDRLGTVQTIHVRQIEQGGAECGLCDRPATWLVATGANPLLEPQCGKHAAELLLLCAEKMRGS